MEKHNNKLVVITGLPISLLQGKTLKVEGLKDIKGLLNQTQQALVSVRHPGTHDLVMSLLAGHNIPIQEKDMLVSEDFEGADVLVCSLKQGAKQLPAQEKTGGHVKEIVATNQDVEFILVKIGG